MKMNLVRVAFFIIVLFVFSDFQVYSQDVETLNFSTIPSPNQLKVEKIVCLTNDNQYYLAPTWSPDGTMIAFTRANYIGIEVMNSDGSNRKTLTDEIGAGYKFSWSPDSKEIAYRASVFTNGERYFYIRKVNVSTGAIQNLSGPEIDVQPPQWSYSQSEKYVSFISLSTGNPRRINTPRIPLEKSSVLPKVTFQSNANKILYYFNENIWIMDETGGNAEQLTHDVGFSPVWSPDRSKIIYSHWDTLIVIDFVNKRKIILGRGIKPSWSPDGKMIVYQITTDNGHEITGSELYITNTDGTQKIQLTNTPDEFEFDPCWSPDGKRICYTSLKTGQIYVLFLKW